MDAAKLTKNNIVLSVMIFQQYLIILQIAENEKRPLALDCSLIAGIISAHRELCH
jgi:hypothetical protein